MRGHQRLEPVHPLDGRQNIGDQVAVVSGLKDGQEVVTSGVFKLRNGAAIEVNNKIQPANNPAPPVRWHPSAPASARAAGS